MLLMSTKLPNFSVSIWFREINESKTVTSAVFTLPKELAAFFWTNRREAWPSESMTMNATTHGNGRISSPKEKTEPQER